MLNEKHGYIDPKEFLLDEITEEAYNVFTDDTILFTNWFYYPKSDGVKKFKNESGISFYTIEKYIGSKYLNKVITTIVRIDNYDTAKSNCMEGFIEDKDAGFYQPSNDNRVGYIYLNYNMLKEYDDIKTELKDTIYHEIRHFFDDTKNIIPQRKKGTIADQEHYVNVVAENTLGLDIVASKIEDNIKNKTDIKAQERVELIHELIYILEPTEQNAFYHSLVVQLKKYKENNPDCTMNDIKEFINNNHKLSGISSFIKTEVSYKKLIRALLGKDTLICVYFLNKFLTNIKNTNEWVKKQNIYFKQVYLKNKDPWVDDISEEDAELAIRKYVKTYLATVLYKRIKPMVDKIYKNIDKLIADTLIGD